MFRTRRIGHITLYSNEKGKWTHASVAKTNILGELIQDKISPEEYRKRLLQQVSDESRADELLRRNHELSAFRKMLYTKSHDRLKYSINL